MDATLLRRKLYPMEVDRIFFIFTISEIVIREYIYLSFIIYFPHLISCFYLLIDSSKIKFTLKLCRLHVHKVFECVVAYVDVVLLVIIDASGIKSNSLYVMKLVLKYCACVQWCKCVTVSTNRLFSCPSVTAVIIDDAVS